MKGLIALPLIAAVAKPDSPIFTVNSETLRKYGSASCSKDQFVLVSDENSVTDLWNIYHARVLGLTEPDKCIVMYCEYTSTGPSSCRNEVETVKIERLHLPLQGVERIAIEPVIKATGAATDEDGGELKSEEDDGFGDKITLTVNMASRELLASQKMAQLESAIYLLLAQAVTQLRIDSLFAHVTNVTDELMTEMATAREGISDSNSVLDSCNSRMQSLLQLTQP